MLSDRCPGCLSCLSCLSVTLVYCGQTAGWIKIPLGTEVDLGPGDIVLDGDPAPPPKRDTAPNFRPVSVWPNSRPSQLLLTAEHLLFSCAACVEHMHLLCVVIPIVILCKRVTIFYLRKLIMASTFQWTHAKETRVICNTAIVGPHRRTTYVDAA